MKKLKQEYLDKIGLEISRMKEGSIALVNQITTISKMRIFDPRNIRGVLSGVSLSEENMDEKGPMKLMLHEIQNELGYIPFEAMEKISETIGVPVSKVYGVVTFYSQFTTEPKGKHVIAVCLGTACYVNGSQTILDLLCEMTGCEVNSTSPDGLFSIDATRCVGACGLAPVVSVDGIVFGCTKQLEDLKMLVLDYLKEEAPC